NNWHAMITSYYNWTAATKILESSIASVETRKLYQRFLDALTWYGDGISEETYAGKLVKFVAALERITVTSGEKAGYNKVARRALAGYPIRAPRGRISQIVRIVVDWWGARLRPRCGSTWLVSYAESARNLQLRTIS